MMPCNINRTGKPFQCEFSMIKNARNEEITMYINIITLVFSAQVLI